MSHPRKDALESIRQIAAWLYHFFAPPVAEIIYGTDDYRAKRAGGGGDADTEEAQTERPGAKVCHRHAHDHGGNDGRYHRKERMAAAVAQAV